MENLQKLSYSLSWWPRAFCTIFLALHGCHLGPSQLHNDVKCSMGLNNISMFLNWGITLHQQSAQLNSHDFFFFFFLNVYGHRHTPSPRSNLEGLGLSTRRAMTRHIRMGVLLNRQACHSLDDRNLRLKYEVTSVEGSVDLHCSSTLQQEWSCILSSRSWDTH
jgi:hypothetical protein